MAISALFRVAAWCLVESPGCRRAAEVATVWGASGGATYLGSIEHGVEYTLRRFRDGAPASTIQSELDSSYVPEENPGWIVTDFPTPFELRKLQWRLSRAPAGGTLEDVAVCTFHFIKATGGAPGTYVDGTDLPAVETALSAYWTSLHTTYNDYIHSDQYRWYKDGPAFYELNDAGTAYVPLPAGNPAIRVTEVDSAGVSTSGALPPQCAITVTERTSSRRHWGRWYLPAPVSGAAGNDGRLLSATLGSWLGYAVTFYNACRAAHMVPVVFSIQKPERPKKPSGTLPAEPAVAYEVLSLQMDDIFDIIRSRRWGHSIVKTNTALT